MDAPVHYGPRNYSPERLVQRWAAFKLQCIAIAIFSGYIFHSSYVKPQTHFSNMSSKTV